MTTAMLSIFAKEFNSFLDSFVAYVVVGVFLTSIGLLMWVFPETSVLDYSYADMSTLFSLGPYTLVFLIPAITMKSFAEEKKLGTLELLLTRPVSLWGLVVGKFLAAYALAALAIAPSLVYCVSIYMLGSPVGNLDISGIITSYLGLMMLTGGLCAVGIAVSALTSSQLVAFVLGGFLCMACYTGFDLLSSLTGSGDLSLAIKQWGMLYHYQSMSRGLIDSRDALYFLSVIGFVLVIARTILSKESR